MKQGYLLFHLNILFSSISEGDYPNVIEKCYWPILGICEQLNIPVNIELSRVTYDIIKRIDPLWIAKLQDLVKLNQVEIVQCGYTQVIGPLIPEKLLQLNLNNKIETSKTDTFLVNEMALDFKTLCSYHELGIDRIIFEEESIARSLNYLPSEMTWKGKLRIDTCRSQNIVWSSSMLFQQFQRYIHGQTSLDDYINFFERDFENRKYISVYSSDAEIFNFRPGRFQEEQKVAYNEWLKIGDLLNLLKDKVDFVRICDLEITDNEVEVSFNIPNPVFVKKQDKYNLARWSLTGRQDSFINSRCFQTYRYFDQMTGEERLELLFLWSSDFRTHIELDRWEKFHDRLLAFSEAMANKYTFYDVNDQQTVMTVGHMDCELNRNNGSIHALSIENDLAIKSLYHKDFIYTDEAADFYSGGLTVFNQNSNRIYTDYVHGEILSNELTENNERYDYYFNNSDFEASKSVIYFKHSNEVSIKWSIRFWEEANRTIRFCNFLIPRSILDGLTVCDDYTSTYLKADWKRSVSRPKSEKISSLQLIPLPLGRAFMHLKNGSKIKLFVDDSETTACSMLLTFNQLAGKDYYRLSFSVSEIDDTSKIRSENIEFKVRILPG